MYKYLTLAILLVVAGSGVSLADPCVEACDAEYDADHDACVATFVAGQTVCDQQYSYAVDICWNQYLDCLAHCFGDPMCEGSCAEIHAEYCLADADNAYNWCMEPVWNGYYTCEAAAEIDHTACLEACALPLNKTDWGQIKSMYR